MRRPAVLLILDGYGIAPPGPHNAVASAKTPHLNAWRERCSTLLEASGPAVGLPEGQMGSSEVNHLNMGAGRVVPQDILRISNAIADGSLAKNPILLEALHRTKREDAQLHLLGLLSDGGVHSHIEHCKALARIAEKQGVRRVLVHAILDGRDTAPKDAERFLREIDKLRGVTVATLIGRFYAMDRDRRWDRTEEAYAAIVGRRGRHADHWRAALQHAYAEGCTDEFFPPTIIGSPEVRDGDTVIFFNFRTDRTRELTEAFVRPNFTAFDRGAAPKVHFVQMTEYDKRFRLPTLFPPLVLKNVLAEWLSVHNVSQLHIAETERYAHVTYFFNGGREDPFPGEDRTIIDSPKVRTYDETPRMSVDAITAAVRKHLSHGSHDVYIVNFANSDMVGHTGNYEATLAALAAMDENIGLLIEDVQAKNGFLIITADHGNAEDMAGAREKTHTTNPVPFIIVDEKRYALADRGIVPDVAATMLALMGLPQPEEMTGRSLLR